ncbi:hypothetical protein TEA_011237 [Camellia sinensis var. sinensis]|uniref:DUF506 domain-containing protein n=1 Tax=Camellia sinensis var. sinensis TaxID=542762 RepID=A0A4S4DQA6_CAMSN|nr:hypothetical protein TEA_011237 [Camellia sinensis var. sinensis]
MDRQHRAPVAIHGGGGRELASSSWLGGFGGCSSGGGGGGGQLAGFSHESEHDLSIMVRDFLENGSSGNESWCSSESDSGSSDLASLADKILCSSWPHHPLVKVAFTLSSTSGYLQPAQCLPSSRGYPLANSSSIIHTILQLYKHSVDQYESDLVTVVQSSILSIDEANHQFDKSDSCSASCIRLSLVKLLQSSGYDAAICATKWQVVGKIPGGDHEFIDVINHCEDGCSERYIIDIDFRSHFEIARAVRSYDVVLRALPPVYVGSISKLKQLLQAMVEASRLSLKQNSMPLPPWRSLAYLQAKWESTCQRVVRPYEQSTKQIYSSAHQQCSGLLRRLKSVCDQNQSRNAEKISKNR